VPVKSPEQQGAQMLTRVRAQFISRRTQLANSIRGYAAEFGFTAPKGPFAASAIADAAEAAA